MANLHLPSSQSSKVLSAGGSTPRLPFPVGLRPLGVLKVPWEFAPELQIPGGHRPTGNEGVGGQRSPPPPRARGHFPKTILVIRSLGFRSWFLGIHKNTTCVFCPQKAIPAPILSRILVKLFVL